MTESLSQFFLQRMLEHFEKKYSTSREDFEKEMAEKYPEYTVYYAHDLCRCSKLREYEQQFPDIAKSRRAEPAIILGELVHLGMENILTPAKSYYKVIDDLKVIISGSPDFIYNNCPVELKYQRYPVKQPKEHHLLRIRLYMWLMDVSVGYLFYITPKKISEFQITQPLDDDAVRNLVTIEYSPRFGWECKFCPFAKICSEAMSDDANEDVE